MRHVTARSAASAALVAMAVTGVIASTDSAHASSTGHAAAKAAPGGVDRSQVWVVSSAEKYQESLAPVSTKIEQRTAATGSNLVLSTTTSEKLAQAHAHHHLRKDEHHGVGYRAFASKAEAEAFIAGDKTAQTVSKTFANYTIDNQATVNPWFDQVDHTNIKNTIEHLSTAYPNRYYSSKYGKQAAEWIRDTWTGLAGGRSDVTTELFDKCTNCSTQPSVLMTVKGSELPDEYVVLGGHIDSISNSGYGDNMKAPGADDDASGTATITEIARIALQNGWKPKRTVVFAGYAAEEVGLRGSNAVAQDFRNKGRNVVGVMQADMTNYDAKTGEHIAFMTDYTNGPLTEFAKQLFDTYLKPLGLKRGTYTCGYGCSDHASWTSAGYPSFMGAEPELFNRLHTTGDILANLGNTAAPSATFAKMGLAFLGEMAKTASPQNPTPSPTSEPTTPSPTSTPEPSPTDDSVLVNGQPKSGLTGAKGQMTGYSINVPAGKSMLKVSTSGGSVDVDLYVKAGNTPTTSSYDCRPYRTGNSETCSINAPKAGTYYVGLYGYAAYADVSLTATHN